MSVDMPATDTIDLPNDDTPVRVAAEMYAHIGFKVLPVWGFHGTRCACHRIDCPTPGKHPVLSEWQKRASSDLNRVRDMFGEHRGNIGLMMDRELVCLDADGETGIATLQELDLPPTLTARTGSGGEHRVFAIAKHQSADEITNRAKRLPGLDLRTREGQIVAAPSIHHSGNRYQWIVRIPPAVLPDAVYEKIRKPRHAEVVPISSAPSRIVERARAYLAKIASAVSGNGGHAQTFAAARAVFGFVAIGLSESDAWSLLNEYNGRCDPPWSERELRHKFNEARKADRIPIIEDRQEQPWQPAADPADLGSGAAPTTSPDAWKAELIHEISRGKERLAKHLENAIVIVRYHPKWQGKVRLDRHSGRITVTDPPWHASDRSDTAATEWTDDDSARLSAWIKREFHIDMSIDNCDRAVTVASQSNSFHPVRDYFDSLTWDQSPRLNTAAHVYFGAEQSDYVALVVRWWMIAAVARTYEPGCKVDNVLILEGAQGLKKSLALKILASPRWFSDTPIDLQSKDAYLAMAGKLIVELAELESLRKADAGRAKAFFTSPVDHYRPPYGKRTIEVPRGCVFAGTVNHASYLQDTTGNRRYWPIACTRIDADALGRDRDALWAEAAHWYRAGAAWWPTSVDEQALCSAAQEPRAEGDDWESRIENHLRGKMNPTPAVGELLEDALGVKPGDWTRGDQMRVGSILQRLGYERYRESVPPRTWRYRVRTKVST